MNRQIQKGIFSGGTSVCIGLYLTALFLMAVGAWLCSSDEPLSGAE